MKKRLSKKLNQLGHDPFTRFICAALEGNQKRMCEMLSKGYNINESNENGETAFSWCCQYNKLRSAKFLYRNGANINALIDKKATPLDIAVCWSSPYFRKWLKSIGGERKKDFEAWKWPPSTKINWKN